MSTTGSRPASKGIPPTEAIAAIRGPAQPIESFPDTATQSGMAELRAALQRRADGLPV